MKEQAIQKMETSMQRALESIAETMNNEIRMSRINTASEILDELRNRANMIDNLLSSSEAKNIRQMSYGEKFDRLHEKRMELYTISRTYWKASSVAFKIILKI